MKAMESSAVMGELPILNRERLDLLFDGDMALVAQVLEIVEVDFPELCRKLLLAIDAGETELVQRHAHTLKGSLANVGGDRASAIAAKIDRAAKESNLSNCMDECRLLNQTITAFLEELRTTVGRE